MDLPIKPCKIYAVSFTETLFLYFSNLPPSILFSTPRSTEAEFMVVLSAALRGPFLLRRYLCFVHALRSCPVAQAPSLLCQPFVPGPKAVTNPRQSFNKPFFVESFLHLPSWGGVCVTLVKPHTRTDRMCGYQTSFLRLEGRQAKMRQAEFGIQLWVRLQMWSISWMSPANDGTSVSPYEWETV